MSEETKKKLLLATRNLIDSQGLSSVSMRTMGRIAGLSRSAVYRHFADKESLLAEIVKEDLRLLKRSFETIQGESQDPAQQLFAALMYLHQFGHESKEHYQLIFSNQWDAAKFPDLYNQALEAFNFLLHLVTDLLRRKNLDTAEALEKTAMLFAFIHGLIELHIVGHFESEKGFNDTEKLLKRSIARIVTEGAEEIS